MLGPNPVRRVLLSGVVPALLCCLAVGCSKGNRISGKVTFKGQPIPSGKIYFIPDATKGNSGPTGFAMIKDGAYDTSAGGRGAVGGQMIVAIEGFDPTATVKDPESGEDLLKPLFPRYETAAELPNATTTKDFDVPASAEQGPAKTDPNVIDP